MESNQTREPWNKGKLAGGKPPLRPQLSNAVNVSRTQGMTELRFTWPLFG